MGEPRNPELRQKPTVEAGIVLFEAEDAEAPLHAHAPAATVIYEPGNGSRYVVHFTPLQPSEEMRKQLGWGGGGRWKKWSWSVAVVVDVLQGTASIVHRGIALDPARLAKDLQRSRADGIVLAELVAYVLGVDVVAHPAEAPRAGLVELPGVCRRCGHELRCGHRCQP